MNNAASAPRPSRAARWLARASWGLVALAYLAFFVTDLRLDFAQLQAACAGAGCNYLALSQAEIDVLEAWGLSARAYSFVVNGASAAAVAASLLLGGLILWRQGHTRIGWSVSLAIAVMPMAAISDANNLAAAHASLIIPAAILSMLGFAILILFVYLFPNGRFYPAWAFAHFIATYLVFALYNLDFIGLIALPAWAEQSAAVAVTALLAMVVGFQILRYRRESTRLERQQTKWIVLGIAVTLASFPIWMLIFDGGLEIRAGQPRLLASLGGWLGTVLVLLALPATLAIAIQRYRLWDIDLVIRRTLIYSALTGGLALVYLGSVVLLQALFRALTGQGSQAAVVASTLAIAALFNPLQRSMQATIDRRFYRRKYDAERVLADFAGSLRDEVDLDRLAENLVSVVEETMQPARVSLLMVNADTRAAQAAPPSAAMLRQD